MIVTVQGIFKGGYGKSNTLQKHDFQIPKETHLSSSIINSNLMGNFWKTMSRNIFDLFNQRNLKQNEQSLY